VSSGFSVVDVGADTLVFVRPRATGQGQEGLVVDSQKLLETLKARVLEARGLDEVAELDPIGDSDSLGRYRRTDTTAYVFSHQFGAPFQALRTTLRLKPLAEPDEGSLIYPLTAVLASAIVLGLFALYRMAATHVRFAERRSNFVSAVSHELKTPLTAIRMHAEMLEEDLVSGESKRREYYQTITRESERLTRLIDNVLALAQVERKLHKLDLRVGDIGPIVLETMDVLRPQVEKKEFALELVLQNELPSVQFESDALKQVLFNLVENALKYGHEAADRRITVTCEKAASGVTVSVRDRGPGVRREHLKAIFEPFFRSEQELTRKNRGVGIGLSLVKGLALAMGGSVHGQNAEPGFVVYVELPARSR
jgi:signal transduction histidine kinase